MKALVKVSPGIGNVTVLEVEKPVLPGNDWVLIQIKACGVCGTDVHVWQDTFKSWPPVIMGHEFSGIIEEVGTACQKYKTGDRVVVEPGINACGICEFCRSGRMHLCPQKQTLGWRVDGAMTDYVAMPERLLHRIPDNVSFELASICEPLAVAVYNVAEHGKININDFVVVQGSGPIGILSAYMAKRLGAGKVLLTGIDVSEYCRFDCARKMGVDHIVNVQRENLLTTVMELTDGKGADCIIETSGAPSAISGSVDLLKRNGRIIATGMPADNKVLFPWKDAALKAIEIYFSMSTSYTSWDKALGLLAADAALLHNLITWTGSIDDWETVFHSLVAEQNIKAVFTFNQ
jgi:L-iditol 2-dehydrogenase